MSNGLKISVIIPVYNVERYLPKCLESVLGQSRKADEVILVDDGSTDGSAAICDEYAAKNEAIHVIHQNNKGAGAARNAGLQRVTGDYVVMIDADDEIDPDYIDTYCACIERTGCDTCKGTYQRMKQNGEFLLVQHVENDSFRGDRIRTELIPRMIGSAPEKKDSIPMGMGVTFYQTKLIRDHCLTFPTDLISEDLVFNMSYLEYATHVEVMDYAGYHYRRTEGSMANKYMEDRFERCILMNQWEKEFTSRLGIYELCRERSTRQLFNRMRNIFYQYQEGLCGLTPKESRKKLYEICSDRRLRELIAQYPVYKMGLPQQVFVYMIKFRMVRMIYLLFCKTKHSARFCG